MRLLHYSGNVLRMRRCKERRKGREMRGESGEGGGGGRR